MGKPKKTEAELTDMIMSELRQDAQCGDAVRLAFTRPALVNWDAVAMRRGGTPCPPECRRLLADIVERLREQFDLAR
jgi:hypothetical protein